jgi:iron complex outermembrane receptor protein
MAKHSAKLRQLNKSTVFVGDTIMYKKLIFLLLLLRIAPVGAQTGTTASALTERDFLGDMPIVLSVSRLAQPLDETPGAVTILDRQFIRMSGARDVADLLRLVPGFQTTTSFETDAPMATYHGRTDDWANRIQVLVDGRSVYSGYLQGSAGVGWQTVALDDIERIEVLRGSNSATYGARAFLGVVNIISRDVRETGGSRANLVAGENGIADVGASLGWGDPDASMYRISVDSRGDDGLRKVFSTANSAAGTNRVSRANFAAHTDIDGRGELDIRIGALEVAAIKGDQASEGNFERMRFLSAEFLQVDWRRSITNDEDIAVSASHSHNGNNDGFPFLSNGLDKPGSTYFGVPVDFKADEFNDVLSFQHTVRHSQALRTVWGTELRQEQIISRTSFDAREQVTSQFFRLFGSAEWRAWDKVVVNMGAMAEDSDMGGSSFSPRLFVNWNVANGHTLRAGVSTAFRPPSAFEKYADVKYYDLNGAMPITTVKSSGQVKSEKIEVQELGYNLHLPAIGLSGDLRLFNEKIVDGIGPSQLGVGDAGNGDNYSITGAEWQLTWNPGARTKVFFNQTWTDIGVDSIALHDSDPNKLADARFRIIGGAPKFAGSLTLMHTLENGVNLTLMHQRAERFAMAGDSANLYSMGRTDIRIAKAFKVSRNNAEIALTVQNLGLPYRDGDSKFYFDRRAMVTLRFEN